MSSNNLGTGILIGMQARQRYDQQDFENERARLVAETAKAKVAVAGFKAQKEAAKACIKALIGELTQAAAGVLVTLRHSDPQARAEQLEDYVDTAVELLAKQSGGKLSFDGADLSRLRRSGASLKDLSKNPNLALSVSK